MTFEFWHCQVNLEGERSAEEKPEIGYPNISFGVEDFDTAFKSLVRCMPVLPSRFFFT